MENDDKSRLWASLACIVLTALAWLAMANKYGLEYIGYHGVADAVIPHFKFLTKGAFTTLIKLILTVAFFWGVIFGLQKLFK